MTIANDYKTEKQHEGADHGHLGQDSPEEESADRTINDELKNMAQIEPHLAV